VTILVGHNIYWYCSIGLAFMTETKVMSDLMGEAKLESYSSARFFQKTDLPGLLVFQPHDNHGKKDVR
jgi:hypothetical protein